MSNDSMPIPIKIVVCDDRERQCNDIADAIAKVVRQDVERLYGEDLVVAVENLTTRANDILEGNDKLTDTVFDDTDLAFIDYRLEELPKAGSFLPTAENIIGSIRAFAGARFIVSVNVLPEIDFDLKELFGAHESTADFSIEARNVANPVLWGQRNDADGFHPSYWPVLLDAAHRLDAAQRRVEQIKWVESNLAKTVLTSLGFGDVRKDRLPTEALSSLFPRQDTDDVSTLDYLKLFSTAGEGLTKKQVDEISKGWKDRDKPRLSKIVCRMCAYKIERWLRLHLLAPQDILVDLPHLVQRAPHVLGPERLNDIGAWNQTAGIKTWEDAAKLIDPKFAELIERAIFDGWEIWFGHPVFWWPDLMENDEIVWPDLGEDIKLPDFVFCEDMSVFVDDENYRPFVIHQASAHRIRYVRKLEGRVYAPSSQFALVEQ